MIFDGPVDIEAAEFSSKEHKLKVFVNIDSASKISSTKDALSVECKLPVHARYHQPSLDPFTSHANVTIFNPKLFMNCSIKGKIFMLRNIGKRERLSISF